MISSHVCNKTLGEMCPVANRSTLQEDGRDLFIVAGVNHNATNRALYSSISMYFARRVESIGGFDSLTKKLSIRSYMGSADEYISNTNISKYFYVVAFSRKCKEDDRFCIEVKASGTNSLPVTESGVFIERSYLDHMQAGPSKDAHIKPIVYHFSSTQF